MNCQSTPARLCALVLSAAFVLAMGQGCHKQKPTQAATPVETESNAVATTSPEAAPNVAQLAPPPQKLDFAPIQQMVQAKDYDKATEELLLLQRSVKNPTRDQSLALAQQMQALQRSLIGAVQAGDPKAKAAIDRINATMSH